MTENTLRKIIMLLDKASDGIQEYVETLEDTSVIEEPICKIQDIVENELVKEMEAASKAEAEGLKKKFEESKELMAAEHNFKWAEGLTKDESIDQILENENASDEVINIILEEMESDGDSEPYSLLLNYKKADVKERAAMDAVLINLCGWSMETIIGKALEQYPDEESDED